MRLQLDYDLSSLPKWDRLRLGANIVFAGFIIPVVVSDIGRLRGGLSSLEVIPPLVAVLMSLVCFTCAARLWMKLRTSLRTTLAVMLASILLQSLLLPSGLRLLSIVGISPLIHLLAIAAWGEEGI